MSELLTTNFSLAEMTRTGWKLPNKPNKEEKAALTALCLDVLEPLRDLWGGPIKVNSGFRSEKVNRAVGGSPHSHHRTGNAADIQPVGHDRLELWELILQHLPCLPIDQAIVYEGTTHIHLGTAEKPRRQLLVKTKAGNYLSWDRYKGPLK